MNLNDDMKVTPQIVFSSEFSVEMIKCIVTWFEKNDSNSEYLPKLREWKQKNKPGHLPVMWGSIWACDVPLYLTTVKETELDHIIDRLLNYDRDAMQDAIQVARQIRNKK